MVRWRETRQPGAEMSRRLGADGERKFFLHPRPPQIPGKNSPARSGRWSSPAAGFLNLELVVAIAILAAVLLPLGGAWIYETKMLRAYYRDAVAMEILDGEMELLAAGEWRAFTAGSHELKPRARAVKNLPPGKFLLTKDDKRIRLEWRPERGRQQAREVKLP